MSAAPLLWLIARHNPRLFLNVRWRTGEGKMAQRFVPANEPKRAVALIERHCKNADVYVGAAPRDRADIGGGKEAVSRTYCLWADCDSAEAAQALKRFSPAPKYVVATGSEGHLQGWWPLKDFITPETAESLNRRLAHILGADIVTHDCSRILRPPGTLNHKHEPPSPVTVVKQVPGFVSAHTFAELPEPTTPTLAPILAPREYDSEDALMSIPPPEYVQALTGRIPNAGGKIKCPFHGGGEERTPSLHVYSTPEEGWNCFSSNCGAGGTIFDFAAMLWNMDTRGVEFHELRKRLSEELSL